MGMKGHPQSNCGGGGVGGGGGNGWMKKKKMAMVAVVILVGVMGVMVVQKVRDRQLYNLVIKDKDRQILSLHLLLQKERQYSKENKRKNQDLNEKLYSLRTQKFELNNKLMEMRSTIGSMKDEQRALELAIEEKQNEIKHKKSEIKDLRSSLQTPPKIWSVSSDDPSNHEVNSTDKISTTNVSSWFGQSSNWQKPNQESGLEGNRRIINPNATVQKPRDSGHLASSSEREVWGVNLDHKDDAKIEMYNTTDKVGSEDNGHDLSFKGRRSFIGASESQRVKGEQGSITQADGQTEGSQPKTNREEGPTEITQFISGKRSVDQETKTKGERTDEDEAEAEMDMKSSVESSNGSEGDQDYKEERGD